MRQSKFKRKGQKDEHRGSNKVQAAEKLKTGPN